MKEQVAAVISSVIHNVEKAFIPCLDRLDEHLDQILEGTELELNPSATPKKPGPVPLFQRFPEIITEANTFLTDNGLAAHSRRRSDTSYSMGTTLQQLKLHLLKTVPGLNTVGISNSAVHLLFRPANKMHTWGRRHHAVLNARWHEREMMHEKTTQMHIIVLLLSRQQNSFARSTRSYALLSVLMTTQKET